MSPYFTGLIAHSPLLESDQNQLISLLVKVANNSERNTVYISSTYPGQGYIHVHGWGWCYHKGWGCFWWKVQSTLLWSSWRPWMQPSSLLRQRQATREGKTFCYYCQICLQDSPKRILLSEHVEDFSSLVADLRPPPLKPQICSLIQMVLCP